MTVYIINVFSIFIWQFILKLSNIKNSNLYLTIIMTIQLFILSAFRHYTVGYDTVNYVNRYSIIANTPFNNLPNISGRLDFEMGYIYVNKFLSYINSDYRFLLIVTSLFILISFGIFIYTNSKITWLSYFVFITLGYWGNSLNVLRQFISISILLLGIRFVQKSQLGRFIFTVLVASTIHTSALFFVVIYPLSKLNLNRYFYIIYSLSLALLFRFAQPVTLWLMYNFGYSDLSNRLDSGSGFGMLILLVIILIGSLLFKRQTEVYIENFDLYIKILLVGILLNVLALNFAMIGRAMLYFTIINIVLIPNLISAMQNTNNRIIVTSAIVISFLWFYYFVLMPTDAGGIVPYIFA